MSLPNRKTKLLKKILRFLLVIALLFGLYLAGWYVYYKTQYPNISKLSPISVQSDDSIVERGRYLSNHVFVCFECHTPRNSSLFAAPLIESLQGAGNVQMQSNPEHGVFYSTNLTPYNLGSWTDAEIIQAITMGVHKNGEPLYFGMPSFKYEKIPLDDLKAMVAYLRTLKPIRNEVPAGKPASWEVWKNMRTWQENIQLAGKQNFSSSAEYGNYLAEAGSCISCHQTYVNNQPTSELILGGGYPFVLPGRKDTIRASNISSDKTYGAGRYTKENFIARFKYFATKEGKHIPAPKGRFQSPMHWTMYAGMNDKDLGAIYDFLLSLPAVSKPVQVYTPVD